ncbi:MAG TPA: hypothetical protein DCP31_09950 [Cyanobacteria bacterium UBA8543]|nr:hypothetical protein [Cyanobacteria bacterium UBA8543]
MTNILHPHEKPWVICRLGVTEQSTRIVGRYANKQDAEDDLRIITRFVKTGGQFVVAFDVVEAKL